MHPLLWFMAGAAIGILATMLGLVLLPPQEEDRA